MMETEMNKITLHGNIVRAEVKTAESGTRYFKATVASDRSAKGDSATDFFPVVAFGDWIDDLADLAKGDFVKVEGTVRLSTFGDEKRLGIEILAKKIERRAKEQAA
jgi:single-stranded DNA-binding protein